MSTLDFERRLQALEKRAREIRRGGGVDFISPYLALPGLVGFWPVSSIDLSSSQIVDLSGQGRVLSQNGNPLKNYTTAGAPYITLDGGGDYVSRADEADLDVLGTESDYAAAIRGLTIGCWVRPDSVASQAGIWGKYASTGNQRSYLLYMTSAVAGDVSFAVSSAGTTIVSVTHTEVMTAGNWYHLVGRLKPSTSLDVCKSGVWTSNTTSVPASVFASTAALQGGAIEGALLLTGGLTQMFICATYLSDAIVSNIFESTRALFDV